MCTQVSPKIQEEVFMAAYKRWLRDGSDSAWKIIWERVVECCRSIAIYKCPGFPLVDDRAMDAAIHVMELIKRGYKPKSGSLSKFCSYPVTAALHGPKAVKEDTELGFDDNFLDESCSDENVDLVEYNGRYFDMNELMEMSRNTGVAFATILKDFKKLSDDTDLGYDEIIELLKEHYSEISENSSAQR